MLSCLVLDGKFGRSSDIFFKLSIVFLFYFQRVFLLLFGP